MDAVTNILTANCNLPLSLIIVGVGQATFDNMKRLDGDDGLFDSMGHKAPRDIVQFVPFRDVGLDQDALARELLAELPGQVVSYMVNYWLLRILLAKNRTLRLRCQICRNCS
jgi:hypothetical protein